MANIVVREAGYGTIEEANRRLAMDVGGSAAYYAILQAHVLYDSDLNALGSDIPVKVGGDTLVGELEMTIDNGMVYADGDVLAETQELSNGFRVSGGTGVIHSVVVLDKDDQAEALDVVFFQTEVSLGTENAAVSISDADAQEIYGLVEVAATDYVDLGSSQVATKDNIGITIDAPVGVPHLYVGMISRGTGTYTVTGGLRVSVGILRD